MNLLTNTLLITQWKFKNHRNPDKKRQQKKNKATFYITPTKKRCHDVLRQSPDGNGQVCAENAPVIWQADAGTKGDHLEEFVHYILRHMKPSTLNTRVCKLLHSSECWGSQFRGHTKTRYSMCVSAIITPLLSQPYSTRLDIIHKTALLNKFPSDRLQIPGPY